MDLFHGMEVGAEVELNDGSSAIDDHTSIKLENKRDLPLWQNLHYFDDSSSDESLDQQYVDSTPSVVKTLEIPSRIPKIRSQVEENKQMEKNRNVLSTTINIQPGAFCVNGEQRDDHYFVFSNGYSKNLQEQAFQFAPHFEESGISCTEVMSDSGQLQPNSAEVYTETTLSYEEDPNLGSYTDVRTRCNKTINPLGRNYKCQRCGRQFLRLYNLDNHVCIEKAFRCPQQTSNNIETMNRLEKMCAEAQKELQSLQGQYKKEVVSTQPNSSEAQTWNQESLSESRTVIPITVPCDHHMCESSSISTQEFQISCDNSENFASQNVTTLKNIVVVDMTDCSPTFPEENQEQDSPKQVEAIHPQLDQISSEWANLNQHLSFQTDENPDDATNPAPEATNIYKCQECGKMYNSRCSFTNHMHWHQGKKISSIVNAEPSPEDQESDGTSHHVDMTPISPKMGDCAKPPQTFTFEYCGKVFNSHVADATHTVWHLKKKGPVTVIPTQGTKQETGQVSSFTTKKQKSDGACTSAVDVFTCQYCGRVFNKLCAYTNHSRWHVKEKELRNKFNTESRRVLVDEECLKEGDAKNALNRDNMTADVDANTGVPDVCLDDGNVQGYCRLVGQLSLDEQHNLPSCEQVVKTEEPSHPPLPMQMESKPQTLPEVLESVLELVVGTEEVHEILLSKAGLVFRKAENYESAEEADEVSGMHSEPEENQISGTNLESAENQIPEMEMETRKNHIPGMRLKPEKAQIPGRQLEPEKKLYSPKILPSKMAAQLLSRPRPPHRCRDCGIRFHQIWRLKQHRLKGFGKTCTLKKHQCDCGRTPIGSLHFLLHQLQHLSDTTFTCAVCNKSLCGYRQLQAHSLVHPLVSQFQCKCGTRFTKLPRYLWHSLKNKAKPKPKMQMAGCTEPSL